jgi:hypothetical protein
MFLVGDVIGSVSVGTSASSSMDNKHSVMESMPRSGSIQKKKKRFSLRRKFVVVGPVLSLTLRDPFGTSAPAPTVPASSGGPTMIRDANNNGINNDNNAMRNDVAAMEASLLAGKNSLTMDMNNGGNNNSNINKNHDHRRASSSSSSSFLRVTSVSNLDPNLSWSIGTRGPPLPDLLPMWQSATASLVYKYNRLKSFPSSISAHLKFGAPARSFITNTDNGDIDGDGAGGISDGFSISSQRRKKRWSFPIPLPALKGSIRPAIADTKTGMASVGIHISTENENHMGWILFTFNTLRNRSRSHNINTQDQNQDNNQRKGVS